MAKGEEYQRWMMGQREKGKWMVMKMKSSCLVKGKGDHDDEVDVGVFEAIE